VVALDISGIVYECDGSTIRAVVGDTVYGPSPISSARVLEDASVYLTLGVLHAVLTERAFNILRGVEPLPEAESVADEKPVVSEEVSPPPAKRSRRR
jgi:hypothetical protein